MCPQSRCGYDECTDLLENSGRFVFLVLRGGNHGTVAVDKRCRPTGGKVMGQRQAIVGDLDLLGNFDHDP